MAEPRFKLLGPLAITHRGVDIAPSAPKLRALLVSLLLNANRTVGSAELVREIWGDEPPPSAHATLQTYIVKLRSLFRDALGLSATHVNQKMLLTYSGGYTLRVDPEQLDITEFERLVSAGSAALRTGNYEVAAHSLGRSLALWRGSIIHGGHWTQTLAQIVRLEERRFYAQTMRIEADLCLGRHHEMISELASLTIEHPLHESAQAMLMIALHRAGRMSAALDVFRSFRGRIKRELGIGPSTRLQALHNALLSADPVLNDRQLTSEMVLDLLTV
ncbi:MAG TPA: AfsR/SARP family transcriptional regulator [Actinophytocola sp.]|nr:AfsR/SARP family transcriptional regulator [Actinophytocola sp.]